MTQPTGTQAELREQIGKIFVQNDLRTDQRAISEIMQLLTSERERVIESCIERIDDVSLDGQHEDVWRYHELVIKKLRILKKGTE